MKLNFRESAPLKLFPILMVLEKESSEVYIVGGAVRDLMKGLIPNDYDIVTDTPISDLAKIFSNSGFSVSLTGINFLVLNVHFNNYVVEIANFRKDVSCDGRHAEVQIGTMLEDANRRDFTVNSLYIHTITDTVIDPTGLGISDSKANILKFVGKPKARIKEDYLRVFRFMRFLNKGFTPDKNSLRATRELWNEAYKNITPERVRSEMEKMVL